MFRRFGNDIIILKYKRQNLSHSLRNVKNLSNAETLEPVKLAYATYESTESNQGSRASPLLILHGLFGSKGNWNSICKVYQQKTDPQRKIVAVDARNHGDSAHSESHTYAHMAADMKLLLEQLGIQKAALMGHSMGGRAMMLFSLKYPELVDKLIIVDISPVRTSPNLTSMPALFQAVENVNLPSNISLSQARAEVDSQLARSIPEKSLRSFLLTNLIQRNDGSYDWRINIPALLSNFNSIARFPLISDLRFGWFRALSGGGNSDYIHTCYRTTIMSIWLTPYELTESYSKTKPTPTVLVVLHGLLGSKNNWNSFCKRYHEHSKSKVMAIDIRNHGDSPHTKEHSYDDLVIDLRRFLYKINAQKVYLLGHSMGGRATMLFALKYPELVEKLIVADISPITTSSSFSMTPDLLMILKKYELPRNISISEARRVVLENLMPTVKNKAVLSFLLTNLVQKSDGSYGWRFNINALLRNFGNISSFPEIHNLVYEGPVLFVGGAKSDYIQKSDYPKIIKLFPKAELKFIDGAGHWLHSEKPAEFLKVTLDFLNKN
ncbi:hypothetical protein NQ318_014974 [Aromia moschata]|uniref:sn-1-specific diacylglycerol lipase ABHD11 n=1 Tax=Aromia moschata TaxID=1265417 RepID=A0AAV8YXE2_9CUCU|nr:hypothetical protein NQ318_014974 [Aromia moschata]